MPEPTPCPRCGSPDSARIAYGSMGFSIGMRRALRLGRIVLARGRKHADSPHRHCRRCGHRW